MEKFNTQEFLLKEYELLSQQKENTIKQITYLERNCIILLGVVWAWLANSNNGNTGLHMFAWFCPLIVILLSWLRVCGLIKFIHLIEDYMKVVESKHSSTHSIIGLNRYNEKIHGKNRILGNSAIKYWMNWIIMTLVSIIVPIYCINL